MDDGQLKISNRPALLRQFKLGGPETRLTGPPSSPIWVSSFGASVFALLLELPGAHSLARGVRPKGRPGCYWGQGRPMRRLHPGARVQRPGPEDPASLPPGRVRLPALVDEPRDAKSGKA